MCNFSDLYCIAGHSQNWINGLEKTICTKYYILYTHTAVYIYQKTMALDSFTKEFAVCKLKTQQHMQFEVQLNRAVFYLVKY